MTEMQLLWGLVIVSLAISLFTAARVLLLLEKIRKESRKSYEVASRIQEDWDQFSERETLERERLTERVDRFENATRDRVDRFEKVANSTRERLIKLEQYLKEFFEVELKSVFDSFDKTVSNILEQMKAELLRGLDRIEDIQAFVDSKSFAQDRILDGEGSVYRLLADTSTPPETEAEPEPVVRTVEETPADEPQEPPYRLNEDEDA